MAQKMTCDNCGKDVLPGKSGWLRVMSGLDCAQMDLCRACSERIVDPAIWRAIASFVHEATTTPREFESSAVEPKQKAKGA